VRRVNPPEDHRALLRAGQLAPLRMDTPMALVEVLRRKLPGMGSAAVETAAVTPVPQPVQAVPAPQLTSAPPPAPIARAPSGPPPLPPLGQVGGASRAPVAASQAGAVESGFIVQAAAFSTADRAAKVANVLGGEVSRSGQLFRVRTGPFATRGEAEASLAKVRAAGYRDARIFTSG
jgi:rare lipoprotein A